MAGYNEHNDQKSGSISNIWVVFISSALLVTRSKAWTIISSGFSILGIKEEKFLRENYKLKYENDDYFYFFECIFNFQNKITNENIFTLDQEWLASDFLATLVSASGPFLTIGRKIFQQTPNLLAFGQISLKLCRARQAKKSWRSVISISIRNW